MLQLSNALVGKTVLSLRTGTPIAKVLGTVINPDNLKIEGFYVEEKFSKKHLVLVSQDIREVLHNGFVVNDQEVLVEPGELVRLKKVIDLEFSLIGKQVVTVSKEKVGKVSDYATETTTFFIQKIYVSQSILKSFTGGNLSIDRSQIQEITNTKVIINDLYGKDSVPSVATAPSAF
ncbi:MAG TPA: hypothetical protein VL989_01560 [Candidatus Sulfotelmatobacter sp.]|nr:hypothetical protein [Candidatus Sulfotelmatobacter sp.]